ncbi:hypothetical protein EJ04DRAFT_167790 [Polyplosphaeria fusca]|uniref:Uncharacterized protein n=1 Tax=Polyplosphaeria fusca TaxID=682080 RepID=A0A9P4RCZ4_9PLEO|nr:hypothetical protein EJ04DRAFT_167790 [Polyplosphaeria fusca]
MFHPSFCTRPHKDLSQKEVSEMVPQTSWNLCRNGAVEVSCSSWCTSPSLPVDPGEPPQSCATGCGCPAVVTSAHKSLRRAGRRDSVCSFLPLIGNLTAHQRIGCRMVSVEPQYRGRVIGSTCSHPSHFHDFLGLVMRWSHIKFQSRGFLCVDDSDLSSALLRPGQPCKVDPRASASPPPLTHGLFRFYRSIVPRPDWGFGGRLCLAHLNRSQSHSRGTFCGGPSIG